MGKVIAIAGQKGGVGKSTLATNLTICLLHDNHNVILVDADKQSTSGLFTHNRRQSFNDETGYTYVQLAGKNLSELQNLAKQYDYVIVDVGGKDDESQRYSLIYADAALFPFEPRNESIDTLDTMIELTTVIRNKFNPDFKAFSVINKADAVGHYNEAAQVALQEENDTIRYLNTPIGDRKAFVHASGRGEGVIEAKEKNAKAISEMNALYKALTQSI